MIANNPSVTDNGRMTQANSIGPSARHFISCEESGGSITQLTDVANGSVIIDTGSKASGISISQGDDAGISVNILATIASNAAIEYANWDQPGDKDCLLFVVFKSKYSGGEGGTGSFYVGQGVEDQLRLQPYYGVYGKNGAEVEPGESPATAMQTDLLPRVENQIYNIAIVKHGDNFSHYVDGELRNTRDIVNAYQPIYGADWLADEWQTFEPGDGFSCGHGSHDEDLLTCNTDCGTGATQFLTTAETSVVLYERSNGDREVVGVFPGGTADVAQDYYGVLFMIFENGAPDDVAEAIAWMKTEWTAGNKVIWPGWSTLL